MYRYSLSSRATGKKRRHAEFTRDAIVARQVVLLSLASFASAPEIPRSSDQKKKRQPTVSRCSFPPVRGTAPYSGVRAATVRSDAPLKGREDAIVPREGRGAGGGGRTGVPDEL